MRQFNKIILEGAVGSHLFELGEDGLWKGQFDLHVKMDEYTVECFDCRVSENDMAIIDGIRGDVRVEGRLAIHHGGILDTQPYVEVNKVERL